MRGRTELIRIAKSQGIELRLSAALLSRAAGNRSRILKEPDGQKSILWSVEFNLLPISAKYDIGINLARFKPLRLVLHDCTDRMRIGSLWYDRLLKMSAEEQDSLVTYAPTGSPPFGLLASWACAKVNVDSVRQSIEAGSTPGAYYFYVQVEQIETNPIDSTASRTALTRRYVPVEIFSTNRLSHVLMTPHLIVHEMPTLWVSRVPLI
ncbi:unnamed protein product [Echinostoma caproni]|uniref:ATG7_N domain-containing protein n=1 Tax=Echinostoma caproni TaxID=27848 RepID=A0A183B357_9TREM|nr:unnamed protein product [Echinostoma caproni]